jgi:hypothetical protein
MLPEAVFPLTVGGDYVKLLLGIKNISLMPCMPSGVCLFRCVFLDAYGSNITSGGPQEVLTCSYAKSCMSAAHIQVQVLLSVGDNIFLLN